MDFQTGSANGTHHLLNSQLSTDVISMGVILTMFLESYAILCFLLYFLSVKFSLHWL